VASACPTSAGEGSLPETLPILGIPAVPFSLETLTITAPYSLTLAMVGLLESLMTAKLVDDITETRSDKDREAGGQGIANVVTGCFGGMAGCAMIGQTMINVRASQARTRISTFCAGAFLLVLVVGLGSIVAVIPMAALVAVMILVAVSTFDWHSVAPSTLKRMPAGETVIMLSTVGVTVATHNLAIGVGVGVLTAMAVFARRVAHLVDVERVVDPDGTTSIYSVTGELFFASDQEFIDSFRYADDPPEVIIDMSRARLGRLRRCRARCDQHPLRAPRRRGRDHGPQPAQRAAPHHALGPARARALSGSCRRRELRRRSMSRARGGISRRPALAFELAHELVGRFHLASQLLAALGCGAAVVPQELASVRLYSRVRGLVAEGFTRFEQLAHLLDGEAERLHALDQEEPIDLHIGIEPEPALGPRLGRYQAHLFVVAHRPQRQAGALSDLADLDQADLPRLILRSAGHRPSVPPRSRSEPGLDIPRRSARDVQQCPCHDR
jgi:hypothetical protein